MVRVSRYEIIGLIKDEDDINVLEVRVLVNVQSFFFFLIRNVRIDVWIDVILQKVWENGGCRSFLVNQEMKRMEEMFYVGNFNLYLKYVLLGGNIVDVFF